jgi:hypothetical protein
VAIRKQKEKGEGEIELPGIQLSDDLLGGRKLVAQTA